MAINKFMLSALRAASYADIDIKKNYRARRTLVNLAHPPMKLLYKMWDKKISVDGHNIPVRFFLPKKCISDEIILFFHGGGWVTGNIDTYSNICAALANHTGRQIASVDYRLAPEHPFPCGLNDCYTAARTFCTNSFKDMSNRIILLGDSAGANLAAAVSLMAAERKEFTIKAQILFYPATYFDHTKNSPFASVTENGTDYLLTSKRICDYMDLYMPCHEQRHNPYFAPLISENLYGQPRTLIITAEYDPLRDEGEAYGEKLKKFGNSVTVYRMKNALHGFLSLPPHFIHVKKSYTLINTFLDEVEVL